MVGKNSLNKFVFLLPLFDKQANLRCSIGSISRLISSRDHNATNQAIMMDRYHSYFIKIYNLFSKKQQGTARTDQKINSLHIYDFCMVVRIFKVATSLSIVSTTRPSLPQQRQQMKTTNFDNT